MGSFALLLYCKYACTPDFQGIEFQVIFLSIPQMFFSRHQIPCRIFETRRQACGQKGLCRSASARLGRIKKSQKAHGRKKPYVDSNINRLSGEVRCLRESCLEVEKGKGGKEGKAVGGGGGILLLSF